MSHRWYFRKFLPGDTQKDPISGAFFQQDALTDTAEALVREAIQNSLDATTSKGKTHVRFRIIRTLSRVKRDRALKWVGGLRPHVEAPDNGLEHTASLEEIGPIIVVEDFGTRGLTGDPTAYQSEAGVRNDFFAFFRAEGYHQKSAQSLGKWGIGKTVFPRSSRLNMFFGYSLRASDGAPLLMGRAVLKTHTADGAKWHPDGYMGVLRSDGLVLPVTDLAALREFCDTFDLSRTTESGLSVVVPYADQDIDESHLLAATLHDYYVPLLEGRLVVEIQGDHADDHWTLTAETLDEVLEEHAGDLPDIEHERIAAAKWALGAGRESVERLPLPPSDGVPKVDNIPFAQAQLDRLLKALKDERAFAVQQPFSIRPKEGTPREGVIDVYFHPSEVGTRKSPVFIRDGIVIPQAGGRTTHGYLAHVLVSGPAAEFVGASENVAHTEWNATRDGFRERFRYAPGTLQFIKNFPADLIGYLRSTDVDQDPDLLHDVFFLDMEEDPDLDDGTQSERTSKLRRGAGTSPKEGTGPERRSRFRIHRREGGFTLSEGERCDDFAGDVRIRVAYLVRRRNPLTAYAPSDFDLGDGSLSIATTGHVTVVGADRNELMISVGRGAFSCTVTGFDTQRDIVVKAEVVREASGDDDA